MYRESDGSPWKNTALSGAYFFCHCDLRKVLDIALAQLGKNGDSGDRADFRDAFEMFGTSGIEDKVGPTLGAKLDTVVGVELSAIDLFAVDESARATAYVHHHEVTTFGLNDSVVARDPCVRDH